MLPRMIWEAYQKQVTLLEVFCTSTNSAIAVPPTLPEPPATTRQAPVHELANERLSTGLSSVVLTDIHTLIGVGRIQEALQLLHPYLPDVLEAVGLDQTLVDRLTQFLIERCSVEPRQIPASLPEWLQSFAREKLLFDSLPHQPTPEDWTTLVGHCALRLCPRLWQGTGGGATFSR